jgi:hypothetical protein
MLEIERKNRSELEISLIVKCGGLPKPGHQNAELILAPSDVRTKKKRDVTKRLYVGYGVLIQ